MTKQNLLEEKGIKTFSEWQGFVKTIARREKPEDVQAAMIQCPNAIRGAVSPLLGMAVSGPYQKKTPKR